MLTSVKAILWLHIIRLWRYKWSFLNMILTYVVWILLLMLGILLFVPKESLGITVKAAYWTILAWNVISQFSSLIGGWMGFFISTGMVEEHILRGISPFKVITGRVIPGFSVILMSQAFIAVLLGEMFKVDVLGIINPALTIFSFVLLMMESLSYGLIISSISLRTSIPHAMLEILNFAMVGLLMMPVTSLPPMLGIIYLAIPYVAPTYLMKIATIGGIGGAPLYFEAMLISVVETLIFLVIGIYSMKRSEEWMKRNGVRAVGFW